jgi:predicted Zn-dependent peptidase
MGGGISSDAGNNSLSAFIRVLRPDLGAGLEIMADVLCRANLPEKSIAREKEVQLATIKAEEEEMTSVARNLLRSTLLKDHPYGLPQCGHAGVGGELDAREAGWLSATGTWSGAMA